MAIPKFDAMTGKPLTPEQIAEFEREEAKKGVQLSSEQQASINWATKHATANYKKRIEALIPRLGKEYVTTKLVPLLEGMELSFDATGEPVAGALDTILDSLESAPDHLKAKKRQPGVFSLASSGTAGLAMSGEGLPEGATVMDPPDMDEHYVTPEQAENVVDEIMAGTGHADLVSSHIGKKHGEVIGNPASN